MLFLQVVTETISSTIRDQFLKAVLITTIRQQLLQTDGLMKDRELIFRKLPMKTRWVIVAFLTDGLKMVRLSDLKDLLLAIHYR